MRRTESRRAVALTGRTRRVDGSCEGSAPPHRNRVAARETAIAWARSAIARSLEVTIGSLVQLGDRTAHQLSSNSLRGVQLEALWRARTGKSFAAPDADSTNDVR